jgi:electron transport complex protein RnfC
VNPAPPLRLQPPRPAWGLRLPTRKSLTAGTSIRVLDPPGRVTLALAIGGAAPLPAMVVPGQRVLRGEPIAGSAVPGATRIHSSIAGTVTAIGPQAVAGAALPVPCVTIEGDGDDTPWPGYAPVIDADQLPAGQLCQRVAMAGIVGLGGALFPTAGKLSGEQPAHTLLVNGVECEPYISCDDALLRERTDRVVDGARLLLAATGIPRAIIAIKSDMRAARVALYEALQSAGDPRLDIAIVTARYPAGGERQLVELVLGCEVPAGGLPRDAGVVCQNVATAAAVADFLRRGQPLISRLVTVTGGGIATPCNVEARLGTAAAALVAAAGGYSGTPRRLIMGGPMMGIALADDELPITAATNCLLAATAADLAGGTAADAEQPCIRCGDCVEACPARLQPQELLVACRQDDVAVLDRLGVAECIECGACDYACPSHIQLTRRFIAAKSRLQVQAATAAEARLAEARYAARTERLAREAARREQELAAQLQPPAPPA